MMNEGIKNAITHKTEFHECLSPAETVYRTDIIVTTGHDIPSLCLKKKVPSNITKENKKIFYNSYFETTYNRMWMKRPWNTSFYMNFHVENLSSQKNYFVQNTQLHGSQEKMLNG